MGNVVILFKVPIFQLKIRVILIKKQWDCQGKQPQITKLIFHCHGKSQMNGGWGVNERSWNNDYRYESGILSRKSSRKPRIHKELAAGKIAFRMFAEWMNVGTAPISKLKCLSGKLRDESGAKYQFSFSFQYISKSILFSTHSKSGIQRSVVWCLAIEFSNQGFQ